MAVLVSTDPKESNYRPFFSWFALVRAFAINLASVNYLPGSLCQRLVAKTMAREICHMQPSILVWFRSEFLSVKRKVMKIAVV